MATLAEQILSGSTSYANPLGINTSNLPYMAGGPVGTGSGVSQGGGFLSGLSDVTGAITNLLGGTGGQLLGTGLSLDALNEARQAAKEAVPMFQDIGARAQETSAFKPFTVSTGFGGISTTPEGGFTTTLSPAMAAQQQQLQGITSGLLGGMGGMGDVTPRQTTQQMFGIQRPGGREMLGGPAEFTFSKQSDLGPQAPTAPSTGGFGAGIPDVSGIQQQALGGVGGFLTGAMAPMAQREADVYERIRATQRPEEQRAQLELEERLAAQGRTGLRTAQFGGSPEQFALAQAQEEAKARASLGALGQAQAEQLQQMGLAESMFGLGGRAAGLPQALQAGQLQNIGLAQAAQYLPEQQLLASLTPGIQLASLADLGRRQGAGLMTEAGVSGLEDIVGAEQARAQNLAQIYSALLGAQGQQAAASAGGRGGIGGLFGEIGDVGSSILDILGIS